MSGKLAPAMSGELSFKPSTGWCKSIFLSRRKKRGRVIEKHSSMLSISHRGGTRFERIPLPEIKLTTNSIKVINKKPLEIPRLL